MRTLEEIRKSVEELRAEYNALGGDDAYNKVMAPKTLKAEKVKATADEAAPGFEIPAEDVAVIQKRKKK